MLQLTIDNHIANVTLNRPDKLNALNIPMFKAIDRMIGKLSKANSLRAVIISANGTDFCTGIDTKSVMNSKMAIMQLLWKLRFGKPNLAQRICIGWRKLPVPVIAVIHGRCWGAGMQLALGADFRIAHANASLSIMEGRWGLIPDMGGTLALKENLGLDQAMMLAMTAREITATEALGLNIVTEVTEQPQARARAIADELAQKSPVAVAGVKQLFHRSWVPNEAAILRRETILQLKALWRLA